jgi:hypothetical protein
VRFLARALAIIPALKGFVGIKYKRFEAPQTCSERSEPDHTEFHGNERTIIFPCGSVAHLVWALPGLAPEHFHLDRRAREVFDLTIIGVRFGHPKRGFSM